MIAESKNRFTRLTVPGRQDFIPAGISDPVFGSAEPPCDVAPLLFLPCGAKFLPNFFPYPLLFSEYFVKLFSNN
jgi:hypothetical protein